MTGGGTPIRTVLFALTLALLVAPPLAAAFDMQNVVRAVAAGWTYQFSIGTFRDATGNVTVSGRGCEIQKSAVHGFAATQAPAEDSFQTSTQAPRHIKVASAAWTFEGDFVQNGPEWIAVNGTGHDAVNGLDFVATPATQPICPVPTVGLPLPVTSPVPLPRNPVINS